MTAEELPPTSSRPTQTSRLHFPSDQRPSRFSTKSATGPLVETYVDSFLRESPKVSWVAPDSGGDVALPDSLSPQFAVESPKNVNPSDRHALRFTTEKARYSEKIYRVRSPILPPLRRSAEDPPRVPPRIPIESSYYHRGGRRQRVLLRVNNFPLFLTKGTFWLKLRDNAQNP